ncbi:MULTISPECIES: NUMOD4 domain-containing protein [Thermoactinomyces]|uniref:NUMOD4 domain-containing protein n=1 Tax=Thermoactinomyces daqus TaxID=1329516 RepID=A0A7W2AIC4_9BACL|nr:MULTISPECIES: NUMOD4 domain-containing protein [Thermoactinomyces]MBA4542713.1 hypothetical protein [Thermoactinomyces daqus]MBH8607283.1 hypothetical protein [Thermoactinomyces sp. CICC 10521]
MIDRQLLERWEPVKGYEGLYSISNYGRIRREQRVIINIRGNRQVIPEKILRPYYRRGWGKQITLRDRNGKVRTHLVDVLYRKHF